MQSTLPIWAMIGVLYLLYTVEGQTSTTTPPEKFKNCQCVAANYCFLDEYIDPTLRDFSGRPCKMAEVCCPQYNLIVPEKYPTRKCGTKGQYHFFFENFRPEPDPENTICLQRTLDSRKTADGEYPWIAFIYKTVEAQHGNNEFVCGASLLSTKVVLTAAHCIRNLNISSLKVRTGANTIGRDENTEPYQDRTISTIYQHPQFDSTTLRNDLALILVSEPFQLVTRNDIFRKRSYLTPLCMPPLPEEHPQNESTSLYDPSQCLVVGWGKHSLSKHSTYQNNLKQVYVQVLSRESCQQQLRTTRLGSKFTLDSSFICAVGQRGTDSCEGDGGGPLFCTLRHDSHRFVQVGVVSWGIGCNNQLPSAYASLEANLDWLTLTFRVLNNTSCESLNHNDTEDSCRAKTTGDLLWSHDHISDCQFSEQIMACNEADDLWNGEKKKCCPRLALPKKDPEYWARTFYDPSVVRTVAIGSYVERIDDFPHMALIGFGKVLEKSVWPCGGSLISDRFILSAAHCSHETAAGDAKWALLGELRRDRIIINGTRNRNIFSIIRHHIHPDYHPPLVNNDIMLFELERAVNFRLELTISPICLYNSETFLYTPSTVRKFETQPDEIRYSVSANNSALTLGWGTIGSDYDVSDALRKAALSILPESKCRKSYDTTNAHLANGFESETMICAGDLIHGQASCPGDSGGPLQVYNEESWVMIGIVSIGHGLCGNKREPAIYTKVGHYIEWIKSIVWA